MPEGRTRGEVEREASDTGGVAQHPQRQSILQSIKKYPATKVLADSRCRERI